jgi:ABC-type Mn2+/Zn2+ transport system permease subunit
MFEPMFMRLALAASVASGLTLGVLGVYLAIRRIVFLGLVLANAATLGAAVAEAMGWPRALVSLAAGLGAAASFGDIDASSRVSNESLMGWAYAATSSATVLVLAGAAGGSADTLQLLFGNVLAVQQAQVVVLVVLAAAVGAVQLLFAQRFLLVTFDAQAAKVAGVNTRLWSLGLNLTIGAATAAAVYEIGALSTFALLALPSMAALLITSSLRSTFVVAGALGAVVPALALAAAFYLDLPAGPACVALLAIAVAISTLWNRASSRRGG